MRIYIQMHQQLKQQQQHFIDLCEVLIGLNKILTRNNWLVFIEPTYTLCIILHISLLKTGSLYNAIQGI